MYALIKNNSIYRYPVTPSQVSPNTSFSDAPSKEALSEFGIVVVKSTPQPEFNPETHYVEEVEPVLSGDDWVQCWELKLNS